MEECHPAQAPRPRRRHRRSHPLPGLARRLLRHRQDPRGRRRPAVAQPRDAAPRPLRRHPPWRTESCSGAPATSGAMPSPASTPTPSSSWSGSSSPTPTRWAATPASSPGWAGTLGVAATNDVDALLALEPDCIVHTAMADDRIFEAIADLERFLARRHQRGVVEPGVPAVPERRTTRWPPRSSRQRTKAGVSLFVNGVDPGFANDALPLVLSGHQRAHRGGALLRDAQLQHLQPAHGALRHHGLRPRPATTCPCCSAPRCSPWPGAAWCARSPPVSGSP